ncbi:MAG: sodium/proline symporter PutP [Gammaproteobacteria bacterium]|jgi:sodium/proline symporter|nr:sodium/proline symporter PutP [Gammaproteobacteria bacterium]MBT3859417.1 sodium/proline symporter PutP [Gammaproteobacteria bacterium]MBT3988179.1 sodium/proline symporter PutP [Gammaproteobacteria bacterium]MBT4256018.1 sodium/proline symporter PutP [Gammaproteobacteria bacterium]MBT4583356.1 sodium/proline symporter PutP [Gammaproteobacteria bacterium]
MNATAPLLITFTAYLLLVLFLGLMAYRRTHSLDDYILGGRKLGSVVTALSVGASDMSGWLLLGLPGAIYLSGISEIWIGIGLLIGAYLNWLFVAKPLRIYSSHANNSLTLPDYFENRFQDKTRVLRLLSAFVILLFFTFYTASGLVGGAILFENSFGLDYNVALLSGAFIIVAYTFVGGFLAVVWTDAIQAILMLLALLIAPISVISGAGGIDAVWSQMQAANPDSTALFSNMTAIGLLSLLAWGLGYVGQPHILARFMAVENAQKIRPARRIAMVWMLIVLCGSVTTGLAGIAYFADQPLANPETVFIVLSQSLFNPWVAGIITAAILSAIMSTIDSQLLVSSSVISEDFYRVFIKPKASEKELLLVSRIAVVAIAVLALFIASDRESRVLDLVSYAWAGFGAAFGPVIVFSLFWRKMTAMAAIVGMIIGAVTVVVWSNLEGGIFDLYEIVPGFVFASLAVIGISLMKPQQGQIALQQFDEAASLLEETQQ